MLSNKRYKEIKEEATKRLNLWLEHSTFNEMTCGGRFSRFRMCIGGLGYPFETKSWMKRADFEAYVTTEEFNTKEYDEIISELYDEASKIVTN